MRIQFNTGRGYGPTGQPIAWGHMRHPHSIANYFEVFDQDRKATTIDLEEQQP